MLQRRNRHNRMNPEINAGSMADIAFLLLIFFLVTSQISSDRGLLVKLPPYNQSTPQDKLTEPRNILAIKVLMDGSVLMRDQPLKFEEIKTNVTDFVVNPDQKIEYAASPKDAVISYSYEDDTPYESFIKVYNELLAAYAKIRDDASKAKFNKDYKFLAEEEKAIIKSMIPITISEADKK
jgi:biopolymer transport protein ExbD